MKKFLKVLGIMLLVVFVLMLVMALFNASIPFLVGGVLAMAFSYKMKEDNTNETRSKVISFCFPIIGLIIYAINVGKNDNLAKDCSKWAICSMTISVIMTVLYILLV